MAGTTQLRQAFADVREPVSASVPIAVDPATAYGVVSDPAAVAALADEVVDVRWLEGGPGIAGARFRGFNRNGRRSWATTCRVSDADGATYGYEVYAPFGMHISRWQYEVAPGPVPRTCVVTETNWIKVPGWFVPFAIFITGVRDRPEENGAHIRGTLTQLKVHLEAAPR